MATKGNKKSTAFVCFRFFFLKKTFFSLSDQASYDNYWDTLRALSAHAAMNQMGKFASDITGHLRVIDKPDVEDFFNKYRGQRIPGILFFFLKKLACVINFSLGFVTSINTG